MSAADALDWFAEPAAGRRTGRARLLAFARKLFE